MKEPHERLEGMDHKTVVTVAAAIVGGALLLCLPKFILAGAVVGLIIGYVRLRELVREEDK